MTTVSIRKYASMKGVHHSSVQDAIDSGKIVEGVGRDAQRKKIIIVEKADLEWSKNFDAKASRSPNLVQEFIEGKKFAQEPESEKKGNSGKNEPATPIEYDEDGVIIIPDGANYSQALRVKEIIAARQAALALAEKEKTLIPKELADKQFADIGVELRVTLELIPDKILDNILACDDRQEAYNIFIKEIRAALRDFVERKLKAEDE